MKNNLFILFLILGIGISKAQEFTSYVLYNKNGKEVKVKKLLKSVNEADVVFFGELHNNPISHWFYLQVLKNQQQANQKIQVGAEMFERDNQVLIDEYFSDIISLKKFETECRIWPNYKTDYKPTFTFCKKNNIPFSATNIPRRYASSVYKQGAEVLEKLSSDAKKWLCPLPFPFSDTVAVYKDMVQASGHGGVNLAKAQAIKDATMAHFILQDKKADHRFFHLNGNKHSENQEGIIWYLKQYGFIGKTLSIHTETNADLKWQDSYKGLADYILVVQKDIQ
jgi:uncharacterized iron-regulated protein